MNTRQQQKDTNTELIRIGMQKLRLQDIHPKLVTQTLKLRDQWTKKKPITT